VWSSLPIFFALHRIRELADDGINLVQDFRNFADGMDTASHEYLGWQAREWLIHILIDLVNFIDQT